MKLDSLYEYLILQGAVTNGEVPGSPLPKLYLYDATAADHSGEKLFAMLTPHINGFTSDEETPNYHKGILQLVVTSDLYDEGYDLAKTLSTQLEVYGLDLEDVYIYRCTPRHLPIPYRRNEQNMREFSVNFDTTVRMK